MRPDVAATGLIAHTLPAAPRWPRYLALATAIALVSAAIVFGLRNVRPPRAEAPSSRAAAPAPRAPGVRPDLTPPGSDAAAGGATGSRAPTSPQAAAPAPSTLAPTAIDGGFDIVVASFRTDARATSVTADVAALGLPTRRRTSDGWEQVVAGPFASRADAEEAQERLRRAGLTGTQIVTAAR